MMLTVYQTARRDDKGRKVVARGEGGNGRSTVVYRGTGLFVVEVRVYGRCISREQRVNLFSALQYAKRLL